MGDVSAEPSMEDILSSIKRIIAEEDAPPRPRRSVVHERDETDDAGRDDGILELSEPMAERQSAPDTQATANMAEPPAPVPAAGDAILSTQTASVTRSALDALSKLMVKPEPPSDGTLEGMVREMLRPMLREWMDANLSDMVEAMVQREIAKITGAR